MKNKIQSILNNKKKAAALVMCSALTLTLGAVAVSAASDAQGLGSMLMKNEKGIASYSKDGGQTWTQGTPEGAVVTTDENGGTFVTMGTPPKAGEGKGLLAKNENGKMSYSTDGGKTWSENAPEGFHAATNADGSVSIKGKFNGKHAGDEKGRMLFKNENGVTSYSTDDGQTWTQGTPEGAVVTTDENGGTVTMGTPPKAGEGNGLLAKNENGKMSYSTDGGKTWSENAPEGFHAATSVDSSVSIMRK